MNMTKQVDERLMKLDKSLVYHLGVQVHRGLWNILGITTRNPTLVTD